MLPCKPTREAVYIPSAVPVSYTHLDVYKRQILYKVLYCNKFGCRSLLVFYVLFISAIGYEFESHGTWPKVSDLLGCKHVCQASRFADMHQNQ